MRERAGELDEVARVRLVRDRDYRIDLENGVLWLAAPLPGYDAELNRRFIEVSYRSAAEGRVGTLVGAQFDVVGEGNRAGLSVSQAKEGIETNDVIGVHVSVNLDQGPFEYAVTGSYVRGEGWTAGDSSAQEGARADASVVYRLGNGTTFSYERGFTHRFGRPIQHSDALRLTGSVNDELTYKAGVTSKGRRHSPWEAARQVCLRRLGLGPRRSAQDLAFGWCRVDLRAGSAQSFEHSPDVGLLQLGVEAPLGRRFSLEGFGRMFRDSTTASMAGGAIEFVYHLTEDIGLSVGVSTLSVDDPDLRLVAPWPEGVYYRLRAKS